MIKAVKQYLRQVKKHLCCPHSLRKDFLRQLEDEVLLFCKNQDVPSISVLIEHFGEPEEIAADFYKTLNTAKVSRLATLRLRTAYLVLAAVLFISFISVCANICGYVQTRQIILSAKNGEYCNHNNYKSPFDKSKVDNCTVFRVKTQRKGRDYYWEYHSCIDRFWHTLPPKDTDGSEPYAEDIYVNNNGQITHWHFGEEHTGWIKVNNEPPAQKKEILLCNMLQYNIEKKSAGSSPALQH